MDASVAVWMAGEVVRVPGWLALVVLVAVAFLFFEVAAVVWLQMSDRAALARVERDALARFDGLRVNPWGR